MTKTTKTTKTKIRLTHWDLAAARGEVDPRGSAEYRRWLATKIKVVAK